MPVKRINGAADNAVLVPIDASAMIGRIVVRRTKDILSLSSSSTFFKCALVSSVEKFVFERISSLSALESLIISYWLYAKSITPPPCVRMASAKSDSGIFSVASFAISNALSRINFAWYARVSLSTSILQEYGSDVSNDIQYSSSSIPFTT